jgi:hypothetical protein
MTTRATTIPGDLVKELIRSCHQAQQSFQTAAEAVQDESAKRLLSIYAHQRTRFAEELKEHLSDGLMLAMERYDGASERPTAQLDAEAVLRACLDAELQSLDAYNNALESGRMPTRAHFLVSAQYSLLQRVHERVHGMYASLRKDQQTKGVLA